jgi:hypothetical protein
VKLLCFQSAAGRNLFSALVIVRIEDIGFPWEIRCIKVCNNGQTAAAGNRATGNVAVAQKNSNGVTNTQISRGGESRTKNGKGDNRQGYR